MTFNEGGAFDFQTAFETILERVLQAMESAGSGYGPGNLDYRNVTMEDLPAYEPQPTQGGINCEMPPPTVPPLEATATYPAPPAGTDDPVESVQQGEQSRRPQSPPPGYEETQAAQHRD